MTPTPARPTEKPEDRWETIKSLWKRHEFLYVVAGFLLGLLAFPLLQLAITNLSQLLSDLAPEAVSTLVAVLVIDRIYRIHADKERLQELITQMRSRDNGLACAAVAILRLKGWGQDGSLKGIYLIEANLEGAMLKDVNLEKATLSFLSLRRALMNDVNLRNAYLLEVNLQGASLEFANLQGVELKRCNLKGVYLMSTDLEGANFEGSNLEGADFRYATFNEQTTLPDDTYWTPDTDMKRFTDPNHPNFWRSDDPKSPAYRGDQPIPL